MAAVRYLSADDVLAIADRTMQALGYAAPILRADGRAFLESAVHRAQTLAYYADADLMQQAAALCNGVLQNHPFIDGNKRIAFAACTAFLAANGQPLPASAFVPLARLIIAQLEADDRSEADRRLGEWLRTAFHPG